LPKLPEDGNGIREEFIRAKYEARAFCGGSSSPIVQVLKQPVPLWEDYITKRGKQKIKRKKKTI
jgi:hypothetical protein